MSPGHCLLSYLAEIESLMVDKGQIEQIGTKYQFKKGVQIIGVLSKFLGVRLKKLKKFQGQSRVHKQKIKIIKTKLKFANFQLENSNF
jgi:hypothetical protein